jgi:hypothetical protein
MARADVPEVIKVPTYRHRYFGTPFHLPPTIRWLSRGH